MMNVDPQEIQHFQHQAAQWWDLKGPLRTLHHINPTRLAYVQEVAGALTGKRVLDVGCGGGVLTESLARSGADALGIDLATEALAAGQAHAQAQGVTVRYRAIAAEDLAAEQAATFDVVCCMEMLEHVPEPQSVVRAVADMVKPGGWAVFSTLNRTPRAFALAIVGAEFVLDLIPRGTHDYAKFIKPSELTAWAVAAGLQPQDVRGMHYNPLTQRASLNRDTAVNYLLACQKLR